MADEGIKEAAAKGLVERLKAMSFVEILLLALFSAISFGLYRGIPYIGDRIESYGTKMEVSHREERKEASDEHTKRIETISKEQTRQIESLTSTFDKTLDRLERRVKATEDARAATAAPAPGGTE